MKLLLLEVVGSHPLAAHNYLSPKNVILGNTILPYQTAAAEGNRLCSSHN